MLAAAGIMAVILLTNLILGLAGRHAGAEGGRQSIAGDKGSRSGFLKVFYPLSDRAFRLIKRAGRDEIFGSRETISRLHVNDDCEQAVHDNACTMLSYIQLGTVATCILVILVILAYTDPIEEGVRLERPASGETEYTLVAATEEEEVTVTVDVNEQKVSADELEALFEESYETLEMNVLGENTDADSITGDLNLITQIPGTLIFVEWIDLDHSLIYSDGTVIRDYITEPQIVYLTAKLTYFNEVRLYSFPVRIVPKAEDEAAMFKELLKTAVLDADEAQAEEAYLTLPTSVAGQKIDWSSSETDSSGAIAMLGVLTVAAVIPGMRYELKEQDKKRTLQMSRDYPDLISKFILLLTAGMTCRAAWEKICADYLAKQIDSRLTADAGVETEAVSKASGRKSRKADRPVARIEHYAYEEMLRSLKELKSGYPEAEVYERFGQRCGVLAYQRFGTLIAKNLRRGSRDLIAMLEMEAQDAMEDRKQSVKMQGEEVGTKLLLPMMGMLCIVIAIVVVPAFAGF